MRVGHRQTPNTKTLLAKLEGFFIGERKNNTLGLTQSPNCYFMFYEEKAMTSSGFFNCSRIYESNNPCLSW